jgi:predicted Zn-ribbon and HTH transcriptional regulator
MPKEATPAPAELDPWSRRAMTLVLPGRGGEEWGALGMTGTLRQQLIAHLQGEALDALELSGRLHMREKAVYEHLAHVRRSLAAGGRRLEVTPARCLQCDYRFQDRQRLTPPGRCPACRSTRLTRPLFRVV